MLQPAPELPSTAAFLVVVGIWIVADWSIARLLGWGYRIRIEERALHETIGDAYAAYADRTTYRLVPELW